MMSTLSLKLSRPRNAGAQVSLFTNMSFIIESKGQMNLFKTFTLICSQYEDCCKTATKMSCKERVLLARLVAGTRSNDLRKSLLCNKDLTLEKAVHHVKDDEATSIQATQFSTQLNKAGAYTYNQGRGNKPTNKQSPPQNATQDKTPRRCKFCMILVLT